jgi:glycosyltransferase involved in cell wall biosynthesis
MAVRQAVSKPGLAKQSATPILTVAIPTCRGAPHLAATIDSVLGQSFADFELVIVDDNSPDDTAQVVARYRDPRIRYLCNEKNLGAQGNWNRCLDEARGTYFKLLPQDDVLMPDCLARQIDVLCGDVEGKTALVFCARNIIGPTDKIVMRRGYPRGKSGNIPGTSIARRCVRRGTNLVGEPGGVMFRTALARKVGPFDAVNPYVVDLDYWFRLLVHGDAWYLPQPLVSFRVSAGSWSVKIGTRQADDFRSFIARVAMQSVYGISAFDQITGCFMAGMNRYLRRIFYRFMLKQAPS